MGSGNKFGRNYKLFIQTQNGDFITVTPPFTIEFDITRNILSSANVSAIRIFNLNANNRNQIRKNKNDFGAFRLIRLKAGYGDVLPTIFEGNITQAWSVREGTNFITQIESFDGGFAFANAISNVNFISGTPQRTVVETIIADMSDSGVTLGYVSGFTDSTSKANSYSDSSINILKEITGGRIFIDNGKAYSLQDNECLSGVVQIINSSSGLLGTPVREETQIVFDMLFEPRLKLAQKVALQSSNQEEDFQANFNGEWKVVSLKHRGMISDAVCGEAITSVGLLQPLGSETLTTVGAF